MKNLSRFLIPLMFLLPPVAFGAAAEEIAHLKQFVRSSGCVFIRNGKEHQPAEALEHINKKHEYHKDRITSAEDFVEYSATKSMISRKLYMVRCGDREQEAGKWLLDELAKYRSEQQADLENDEGQINN